MLNRLLLAYYALVVLGISLVAVYWLETAEDASIGGGLALLLVSALGLPWSIGVHALVESWAGDSAWVGGLALAGCAIGNGALGAWWASRRSRRSRQR